MESIYAALLLHKVGGKITEASVEKVLTAAGGKSDKTEIAKLIAGLKETDIGEIIKSAGTASVMAAPAGDKAQGKKEEKKEKEEEVEEEPTGIGSLF
ncbi:MAG: 50S ribosomal protein P1 [Candidatus Lokiarchaeota archaeon]|nr:50S ribosomal protein P1 [Candidatus Lokiarchaeota archaeon]